jgi:hypothetical protein
VPIPSDETDGRPADANRKLIMSRHYQFDIEVRDYDPEKIFLIWEADGQQWEFEAWYESSEKHYTSTSGTGNLAGCGEQEFAQQLTKDIWKANGAFCQVIVNATYLEDLPVETYDLTEEDYQNYMNTPVAER